MPSNATKLFGFNRSLPEPFHKLGSKKVKVSSAYGDGTEATLCTTVIKAVHAYFNCLNGTAESALGLIDSRSVAEYKSALGDDAYHLVVYDAAGGNVTASVYDKNTEAFETYTVGNKARDGTAIMFAMLPALMEDEEFKNCMDEYKNAMDDGFPDIKEAAEFMAILCDNAYRRIGDESSAAHVKLKLEASGNLMRISQTQLDSGSFTPKIDPFEIKKTKMHKPVPLYGSGRRVFETNLNHAGQWTAEEVKEKPEIAAVYNALLTGMHVENLSVGVSYTDTEPNCMVLYRQNGVLSSDGTTLVYTVTSTKSYNYNWK